ncbi:magnesium transporter [Laspinema olomoucense]|uniref:magnesium transporter n=1 Tax=Laspinema olomoucense TaxID=3231600 RepID=UPI0021BB3519|nr:magnesium transporter [Laspinema sp. D3d]MCT7970851.1 magnesium transporter [Laspinema sp. D3d]
MNDNNTELPSVQRTSREELRELVRSQLQALLEQNNLKGAKALLVPVQPPDIAEAIEGLPETMQAIAFRLLSKEEAIEVYEYLDSSIQYALIEEFKRQDVLDIVGKMSPDDRARLFDELPAKVVKRILEQLSPQERQTTSLLLGYPPDSAGRMMTPQYIAVKENMTVTQALDRIRKLAHVSEIIYYLYVTDASRHLRGTISLRDLVVSDPEQLLSEITRREPVFVSTETDRKEAARLIQRYDFLALPVVDSEQRLVGIITVDDVMDVVEAETTKDIYALGGVASGKENYFQTNIFTVARKRVVWLLILLITNTATSAVIRAREDILEQVVALAAFIPLLIDTGGNVGAQSSTVVIRGLNINAIGEGKAWRTIGRETAAGSLLGIMLSLIVTIWAYFLAGNLLVAISVGVSLLAITILASFAGSALPFLFDRLGFEPTLMSAPFITTAVDVLGVLIYLTVAQQLLGGAE